MRTMLEEDLAHCRTLSEMQAQTQQTLGGLRAEGFLIHYVAGPVSCDGEEKIPENLANLFETRTKVMREVGAEALVLTAPMIFSLKPYHDTYRHLRLFDMDPIEREAALRQFWKGLFWSGVIDAVHLAKGWQRSPGTNHERETALELGIPISEVAD